MSSATANHTVIRHEAEEVELTFVDFRHNPTTDEVLTRFKEEDLDRPKAKDALEFHTQLSNQGEDVVFVFLQEEEIYDPLGVLRALVVLRLAPGRELCLNRLDDRWAPHCRFVARRRK